MKTDPTNIDPGLPKAIRRIYREVPSVDCKGLCWEACSYAPAQAVEVEHLCRVAGNHAHRPSPDGRCPFLDSENRCSGYAARPLICRLYGAVRKMECPHGCRPAKGFLSPAKERELVLRLLDLDDNLVILGLPETAR